MKKKTVLQQHAIQAAKNQDWSTALDYNQQILELDPKDTGALNRCAMAYLQLENQKKAVEIFNQVLELDKSNVIAKKQLDRIKNKQHITVPAFTQNTFIEEPGKTKTVQLHRLASKNKLDELKVGVECTLVPKNRYISVEVDDEYVGALPEDLSYRLTKLMKSGNKYTCHIRSLNGTGCSIFLREATRSKKNQYVNSFPTAKVQAGVSDIDESFLLEEDIPVQIVHTDNDDGQDLKEIQASANSDT